METSQIIKHIESELNQIEDWDIETFKFDFPETQLCDQSLKIIFKQLLDISNNHISSSITEYDDTPNNLTDDQLKQLQEEAIISIPSKIFPGHNDIWQVSSLLLSGKNNLKNSLYNGLALTCEIIFVNIPILITNNKYFNIFNSVKNIIDGFWYCSHLFFGQKNMILKNSDYAVTKQMKEFTRKKIIEELIENKNNLKEQLIINACSSDNIIITSQEYFLIIKKLEQPYYKLKEIWYTSQITRRNNFSLKYQNQGYEGHELHKKITNAESELMIEEMINMISQNLSLDESEKLINLLKSVYLLRRVILQYRRDLSIVKEEHHKDLCKNHPILSRSLTWVKKQMDDFEENWIKNNSLDKLIYDLVKQLSGQEKIIMQKNLAVINSTDYKMLKTKLQTEKIPADKYNFKFQIWDPKKWHVINNQIIMYTSITNTSSYFGWRLGNLALRSIEYLNNGCYFLVNNLLNGSFGIKSLFSINEFTSSFGLAMNGKLTLINKITMIGRIMNLYRNIGQSRKNFEENGENSIISKKITRPFHVLWNYLIKGILGGFLISIGQPLVTLIKCIVSIIGLASSPIWSFMASIFVYLINIFVYDKSNSDVKWFPLMRAIFINIFFKGMGQSTIATMAIIYDSILAIGILSFVLIGTFIKYGYDYGMYHLVLKKNAKIPKNDDFLVKKIPDTNYNYYLLDYQTVLIFLHSYLIRLEMDAYKDQMKHRINEKINILIQYTEQFKCLGLTMNYYHERFQRFTTTRNQLDQYLEKMVKNSQKNTNHINMYNIKMNRNNLAAAIKQGAELCKLFVYEHILSRLDESSRESFWISKKLEKDNWVGLSIYCYRAIFNNDIMIPSEEFHTKKVRTITQNENTKHYIKTLYNGIFDTQLDSTSFIPIIEISDNVKTRMITLDNVLSREEYESMIIIDDNSDNK